MYLIKGHIIGLLYFALSTSSFAVLIFVKRFVFLYIKWKWKSNQIKSIQGVIARVISKSDKREARGRFEITSTISL